MQNQKEAATIKAVIYGTIGVGVTTFASMFPDPLFIDMNHGTHHIDTRRFDEPDNWKELLEMIREVQCNPELCKTLILDSADAAERLLNSCIHSNTSQEDLTKGETHHHISNELKKLFHELDEVSDTYP